MSASDPSHLFAHLIGALAQGAAPDIPWVRIVFVMLLCIVLAFVAVGFLRIRYGLPFLPDRIVNPITAAGLVSDPPQDKLAIVDRLAAGPSSQFIVLGRGEKRYLLHISQTGATLVDEYVEGSSDTSSLAVQGNGEDAA